MASFKEQVADLATTTQLIVDGMRAEDFTLAQVQQVAQALNRVSLLMVRLLQEQSVVAPPVPLPSPLHVQTRPIDFGYIARLRSEIHRVVAPSVYALDDKANLAMVATTMTEIRVALLSMDHAITVLMKQHQCAVVDDVVQTLVQRFTEADHAMASEIATAPTMKGGDA